ncbi:MAG TPA: DNA-deoxyinosine glycosylase [Candidatus Limiplasma sp.]|nr:DNA-deoxyinosine glycosylase [Candidatus Limiplasma sp.]
MNDVSNALLHPFQPVVDEQSRVLVLGSFPSVKSRANAFYYGHPQNRFWKLLSILLAEPLPVSVSDKTSLLHRNHIALWDVVRQCDIIGSSDSSLTAYAFNDIPSLITGTQIHTIFANGQKAGKLYQSHLSVTTGMPVHILPSTSPANALWTLDRLMEAWQPLRAAIFENQVKYEEHLWK